MQAFPSPVIGHFLLPDGHEGAIIPHLAIEGRQRSAILDIWGLVFLQIGFKGLPRALRRHWSTCSRHPATAEDEGAVKKDAREDEDHDAREACPDSPPTPLELSELGAEIAPKTWAE
jgi:hypothetical protein